MKKKKRSRASKKGNGGGAGVSDAAPPLQSSNNKIEEEKLKIIESLVAAFGTISFEKAEAAYEEAKGDANKAAEILGDLYVEESPAEDQSTTCSSSSVNFASGSGSGSSGSSFASEVFAEANGVGRNGVRNQKSRQKKVVAAAGIVSTMLGKDYVRSVPKRSSSKFKGSWSKEEEAEQFLCSMLGEDCELGMAVVSDVLCEFLIFIFFLLNFGYETDIFCGVFICIC